MPASWFFDPADKTALVVDYKIDAKGASIALLLRVSAGGVLKTRVDLFIGAGDPSRDRGVPSDKKVSRHDHRAIVMARSWWPRAANPDHLVHLRLTFRAVTLTFFRRRRCVSFA